MLKKTFIHLQIIIFALGLTACQKKLDRTVFVKGPYLQNVKTDGITIMWESASSEIGKVEYGIKSPNGSEEVETDTSAIHEIVLNGLRPETVYKYRVVSGDVPSPVYNFKTAVKQDSPFSFAVYGDNKNGPFNYEKVVNLILSKNPNFVVHNGDFVDHGNVYKQWQKLFFTPADKLIRRIPLFPAIGNHEDYAQNYFNYFSLPNNELWYSFDYGNAHIIVLDSEEDSLQENGAQLKWLIEDLEKNTGTWTFVNFHHPPFTAGGNYYTNDRIFRKNLLHPIFEKYGVDMVLSGHDHNYERTYPIVSRNGKKPITYIVCGNGGTPLRYIGEREWTCYAERVFGFVKVNIDGAKLHFQAFSINDEVIDEFTLDKGDLASVAAYEKNRVFFEDIHDPVVATRYYRAGRKLLKKDKFAEALPFHQKAYQVDSTCVEALRGIAECYYETGKVDTAIHLAKLAIRKKPNYPKSYEVLVDALVSQNNYDEALAWCDEWAEVVPDTPNPNEARAEIYEKQNQYDLAIDALKSAIAILPSDADLYFDLGKLYEKTGDQEKALAFYQKGLEWFMDEEEDEDVIRVRAALDSLTN